MNVWIMLTSWISVYQPFAAHGPICPILSAIWVSDNFLAHLRLELNVSSRRIYGGHIIWRGHLNASGTESAFNMTVMGGFGFGYAAWLNGVHLGGGQGNATVSQRTDLLAIPEGALKTGEDNVLVVVQDHMG